MKIFAWIAAAIMAFFFLTAFALSSALGGGTMGEVSGSFPIGIDIGLDFEQARNATIAFTVADELHAPPLAVMAMGVAGLGESDFRIVANKQGSGYCGVFQADPGNIPCDDTERQARSFLKGGLGFQEGGAIHLAHTRPNLSPGTIAYLVEGSRQNFSSDAEASAFYDVHRPEAEQLVSAWQAGAVSDSFGTSEVGAVDGEWLATVPGTQERCDRRIVGDVLMLIDRYHLQITACYAPSGHAAGGEHPLGLAIDAVPQPPYNWDSLDRMVRALGWRPACGSTGCAGQTGTAMRFIGWDGYPNHGRGNHAHLSWSHGAGIPAATVKVLTH